MQTNAMIVFLSFLDACPHQALWALKKRSHSGCVNVMCTQLRGGWGLKETRLYSFHILSLNH